MARIRANKLIRVIRSKDVVKGSRKPKESGSKPMGVKGSKEEVNELRKPKE